MTAYRNKPVVIEAVEWTGTNLSECLAFLGYRPTVMPDDRGCIIIGTLEGTMKASYGDWIIRGVKGEFYPCKPDIFAATYDLCALPPDPAPTGERRPCAGWLNVVGKSDRILNLIPSDSDCGAVTLRVYSDESWSVSALDGCDTVHLADGTGGELAAEDAAAELLRAGLRALGVK